MALLGLISWSLFVDAFRLVSICFFVVCALSINWYSFWSFIAILISLYVLDRNKYNVPLAPKEDSLYNPFKKHRKVKDEEKVPAEIWDKYSRQILNMVLYDVENCDALRNFEEVKNNTHCIFSRNSVLWGARDYDEKLSIEHNVSRSLPALTKFIAIGSTLHLDGFLFELPGSQFSQDVVSFGKGVWRVLKCVSDADPKGYCCMNKSFLSKIGWSFEFNGAPIFVTTFSSCYPENHSRYTFGVDSSFILLQPMYSFAIHNISPDTPDTNWECPVTERDKIRLAYESNNRGYHIRDTVIYPPAHDIVKPLVEGTGELVEWWKGPGAKVKRLADKDALEKEVETLTEETDESHVEDDPESKVERADEKKVETLTEETDESNVEDGPEAKVERADEKKVETLTEETDESNVEDGPEAKVERADEKKMETLTEETDESNVEDGPEAKVERADEKKVETLTEETDESNVEDGPEAKVERADEKKVETLTEETDESNVEDGPEAKVERADEKKVETLTEETDESNVEDGPEAKVERADEKKVETLTEETDESHVEDGPEAKVERPDEKKVETLTEETDESHVGDGPEAKVERADEIKVETEKIDESHVGDGRADKDALEKKMETSTDESHDPEPKIKRVASEDAKKVEL